MSAAAMTAATAAAAWLSLLSGVGDRKGEGWQCSAAEPAGHKTTQISRTAHSCATETDRETDRDSQRYTHKPTQHAHKKLNTGAPAQAPTCGS